MLDNHYTNDPDQNTNEPYDDSLDNESFQDSSMSSPHASQRSTVDYAVLSQQLSDLYQRIVPWILSQAGNPDDIEVKSDNSRVTNVDKGVEQELLALATTALPQALFVGEETWEQLANDPEKANGFDRVVVVDPIDGTSNFIRGEKKGFASVLGVWSSSATGYTPEFGAVYCPDENCLYYSLDDTVYREDLTTGVTEEFQDASPDLDDRVVFTSSVGDNGIVTTATADLDIEHLVGYASVPDIVSLIRGEGHACVTRGKLWDVAGVLGVAHALGYRVYSTSTMQELQEIDVLRDRPGSSPWTLEEAVVVCKPEHADDVLSCIHS